MVWKIDCFLFQRSISRPTILSNWLVQFSFFPPFLGLFFPFSLYFLTFCICFLHIISTWGLVCRTLTFLLYGLKRYLLKIILSLTFFSWLTMSLFVPVTASGGKNCSCFIRSADCQSCIQHPFLPAFIFEIMLLLQGAISGSFNLRSLSISADAMCLTYCINVQLLLILIETLDLETLLQMIHDEIPFRFLEIFHFPMSFLKFKVLEYVHFCFQFYGLST